MVRDLLELARGIAICQARVGCDQLCDVIKRSSGATCGVEINARVVQRTCSEVVGQQGFEPKRHIRQRRILIAILINDAPAVIAEAEVIKAIRNRIDRVLIIESFPRAVVLHEVEPGLCVVLIIAMGGDPSGLMVRLDPVGEVFDICLGNLAVIGDAGCFDPVHDDLVHRIGSLCALVDLIFRDFAVQLTFTADDVDELVQARTGLSRDRCAFPSRKGPIRQVISQELVQPIGDVFDPFVLVAVFVDQSIVFVSEAEMVDRVRNCIDAVAAKHAHLTAVVLHEVKASLFIVFVIAMGKEPRVRPVVLDPVGQPIDL